MTDVDGAGGLRRRDFLTRLGMAGGAGALFSTMDALGLVASPTNTPAAYAATTKDFRPPAARDFSLRGRPNKTSVIVLVRARPGSGRVGRHLRRDGVARGPALRRHPIDSHLASASASEEESRAAPRPFPT